MLYYCYYCNLFIEVHEGKLNIMIYNYLCHNMCLRGVVICDSMSMNYPYLNLHIIQIIYTYQTLLYLIERYMKTIVFLFLKKKHSDIYIYILYKFMCLYGGSLDVTLRAVQT